MKMLNRELYIINCHMHTEAADFLGGLRPVRNRSGDHSSEEVSAAEVRKYKLRQISTIHVHY